MTEQAGLQRTSKRPMKKEEETRGRNKTTHQLFDKTLYVLDRSACESNQEA